MYGPSSGILFLGTGTPRIDTARTGSCHALLFEDEAVLIDCGPGALYRAASASEQGFPQLHPTKIRTVFLTHLHSDHCLGLPEMLLMPWVVGRKYPMRIIGPPGTKDFVALLMTAFDQDIMIRSQGYESTSLLALVPEVQEIQPGVIEEGSWAKVTAYPVHHGEWDHAYSYRFDVSDFSITFSGDTNPCRGIEKAAMGAEILIHEAYTASSCVCEDRPGGEKWPEYMKDSHTSTFELGQLASTVKPQQLLVTHILRGSETDDEVIAEIRSGGYAGNISIPQDLSYYAFSPLQSPSFPLPYRKLGTAVPGEENPFSTN